MTDTQEIERPAEEKPGTALVVIPAGDLPTVLAADKNDILGKLRAEIEGFEPDVTTPKGRKEIASKAHRVSVAKMDLVRLAGTLKEDAQKTIKGVNAEVRIIEERMDALRDDVRKPLDDFEAEEAARVKAHQDAITEIEGWATVPAEWTAEQIGARIAELGQHPHRDRQWQEFKDRAQRAAVASFNALKVAQAEAEKREAAAAEAARLAAEEAERQRVEAERLQAEREAQIAAEAAEKARREAERKAAEEAAEAERRAQAERDAAAERERKAKEAAEQAERDRQAAEQRARDAEARAEAERVAGHERALAAITETPGYGERETSAELLLRLGRLRHYPVRDWQEYACRAAEALAAEITRTEGLLAAAEKREAEAAEAARKAAEEREAQARQEAAAAERRRIEQQQAAERAAAAERERDISHKRKINREAAGAIANALVLANLSLNDEQIEEVGKVVITAVAKGEVPHMRISY